MSMEDPFFVVKDEVVKALVRTRALHERWRLGIDGVELRGADEQEWSATELKNALRSIEWDLEDLDDTVQIVEKNPAKFRIDAAELQLRKSFIDATRAEVKRMKDQLDGGAARETASAAAAAGNRLAAAGQSSLCSPSSAAAAAAATAATAATAASGSSAKQDVGRAAAAAAAAAGSSASSTKYSRLTNEPDSPYRQNAQQQQIIRQQDHTIDMMSESVSNIRSVGRAIGGELDEQAVMLDEFGTEIENAESKLDATMRKMSKVLHIGNDRRQWTAIGALSGTMVIILILIFAL